MKPLIIFVMNGCASATKY